MFNQAGTKKELDPSIESSFQFESESIRQRMVAVRKGWNEMQRQERKLAAVASRRELVEILFRKFCCLDNPECG